MHVQVMAVPTRDVPLRAARAGIEARLRDTLAQWGDSELSPAPKPEDEAALQSFLRSFEGANASTASGCDRACFLLRVVQVIFPALRGQVTVSVLSYATRQPKIACAPAQRQSYRTAGWSPEAGCCRAATSY